jgi:hypothetical protein
VAARNSLDLEQDPRSAERDQVIAKYAADKGLVETLARLVEHLATMG